MNILLVEDDARIGRLISEGLRRRGCRVEWERVGKNVPELAATGSFNTVIMDLLLPDSDGLDLCKKIRAAEIGTPILVLTARADLDDRLDGFAAGVDDYVAKPFDTSELFARVRALAKRDLTRKPDAANFERLRVDPNTYCATWRGGPIETGRRTLLLLHALARSRGEIVEREKLIVAVWGLYAEITDNALEGCVSSLRRQLAEVTDELTVEAARGRGYALRVRGMIS
jgi:DNA-binding response OmpR family regulator